MWTYHSWGSKFDTQYYKNNNKINKGQVYKKQYKLWLEKLTQQYLRAKSGYF